MKSAGFDSQRRAFRPSVGSLEERNLLSVSGLSARLRPAAQVGGVISAASNGHKTPMVIPLRVLAGKWANQTWVTKVFSDRYPWVPAVSYSVDTNRLVGHSIVSTDTVGEFVAAWSISPGRGGPVLRVTPSGIPTTVTMPGRRVGPSTWVFETSTAVDGPDAPTTRIRSVINIANRNTYSFSNFTVTDGVEQLLYVSVHNRLPAHVAPPFVPPSGS